MTSSWFFLSTLNYDARSTTHQNTINIHQAQMCYGTQKWTLPRSGFYIPACGKFHKALKIHSLALVSATAQPNRTSYSQMQRLYSVTKFSSFSKCYKNFRIQYAKFKGLWANFKTKKSQLLLYSIHSVEAATTLCERKSNGLSHCSSTSSNHTVTVHKVK